jgi:hypothetical protein
MTLIAKAPTKKDAYDMSDVGAALEACDPNPNPNPNPNAI